MPNPAPAETDPKAIQKEGAAGTAHSSGSTHPGGSSTGAPGQAGDSSSVVAAGSVVTGAGSGSGLLNASLFKFPFYLKNIENKISGQWSPPPVLLQEEIVGAIVQFNVTRRGSIESVEIEKSSGNSQFDQAALRAVYNANPLPPLPEGLSEDPLKVHFSFTLQRGS
jgi:TonB family protein